jgi:class 3 adenylate cyclase
VIYRKGLSKIGLTGKGLATIAGFLLAIAPIFASAGEIIQLAPEFKNFWAGSNLDLVPALDAKNPKSDFDRIDAKPFQMNRQVPGFGYTTDQYAARLHLENPTDKSINIHVVAYGPIERIYLQHASEGIAVDTRSEGMFNPPSSSKSNLMFRYPQFSLSLSPGKHELYFGEEAVAPHFPIVIMSDSDYGAFSLAETMKTSGFLAISILILVFAVCITTASPDRTMALYTITFVFSFLLNLFVTGGLRPMIYQLFGTDHFEAAVRTERFIYGNWVAWMGAYEFVSTLFGFHFLRLRFSDRTWSNRFIKLGLVASLLLTLTSLYLPVFAINTFSVPHHIVLGIFCFKAFREIKARSWAAVWLFAGWSVYTVSTALMLLYYFGAMGPSIFTAWGLAIGHTFQSICMAAAIFVEKKQQERSSRLQIERNFKELANRDEIIQQFSSPKIVSEITLGLDPRNYKARWTKRSILISDIRDFTTLVENAEMAAVEEILNTYFSEIIERTFAHNGEVNKMMGDAALCVFDDAETCLTATVALRKRLDSISQLRIKEGRTAIRIGSGITHAPVISMNIGKQGMRLDRTVIGDEVNTAARIESLTKELGVDVLVSQRFLEEVPNYEFQRHVGNYLLKGKTQITSVFEIFEHESDAAIEYKLKTKGDLRLVHDLVQNGGEAEALRALDSISSSAATSRFSTLAREDKPLIALRKRILGEIDRLSRKAS